jgi:LmbE family N-acetylglucosaminyl deacetylase
MASGAPLLEEVPGRALAVYAHPDDPEIACGGTLARWAAAGCEVHVAVCTQGEKGSSDAAVDPEDLARRRAEEMEAAGRVLGLAGRRVLGVADGELAETPGLRRLIVGWIRELRPDVLLAHDPTAVFFGQTYFNHADHRALGWATLDAVSPAAGNPHYFPGAGPAHQVDRVLLSGTLEPDVWVDIGTTIDTKVEAVVCHTSQLGEGRDWFRSVLRQRAEEAGRQAGVRFAEGFRGLRLGTV